MVLRIPIALLLGGTVLAALLVISSPARADIPNLFFDPCQPEVQSSDGSSCSQCRTYGDPPACDTTEAATKHLRCERLGRSPRRIYCDGPARDPVDVREYVGLWRWTYGWLVFALFAAIGAGAVGLLWLQGWWAQGRG